MRRVETRSVALVIASIDARETVRESLAAFLDELAGRGEAILVDASSDGTADEAGRLFPGLRVLRSRPGRLAPELWSDGLGATCAPLVAFSTAAMVPRPGWLAALIDRLEADGSAGVGGPIAPSARLAARDRAVYLHRFVNYLPPVGPAGIAEPPGDNALYRRDRLLGLEPLWQDGFWEVEVHRALRRRGETLGMAADAIVEYRGGTRRAVTLLGRLAHARRYAASRSGERGTLGRLARLAATPAVPGVLLMRTLRALRGRGEPIFPWLPALPDLALLLSAWSLGEALGGLRSLTAPRLAWQAATAEPPRLRTRPEDAAA